VTEVHFRVFGPQMFYRGNMTEMEENDRKCLSRKNHFGILFQKGWIFKAQGRTIRVRGIGIRSALVSLSALVSFGALSFYFRCFPSGGCEIEQTMF